MKFFLRPALIVLAMSMSVQGQTPDEKIQVDRTPLSFRDAGFYCSPFKRIALSKAAGEIDLLSAERAASDTSPWTFFIMQYHPSLEPDKSRDNSVLRDLAAAGKKIILRVGLNAWGDNPLDEQKARILLTNLFTHEGVDPDWLYAITLEEETVFWHDNARKLGSLYQWCKTQWPNLPVYQWWTPMQTPNVRAKTGWVDLPSDGWVIDLYGQPRTIFEKKLLKCLETGKPVVHVAWASPTWMFYDKQGVSQQDWWDKRGKQVLEDQIDVCRAYNVPVAFFATQGAQFDQAGNKLHPILWAWRAVDKRVRDFFMELEARVLTQRLLPDEVIGYRTPNKKLFDWAHSEDRGMVRFSPGPSLSSRLMHWSVSMREAPTNPGSHQLDQHRRDAYLKSWCMLDEQAAVLEPGFSIRGVPGRAVRVPVVIRFVPEQPMRWVSVQADVTATSVLGGRVEMAWSWDAETWVDAGATQKEATKQTLSATIEADALSQKPLFVRLTLINHAGAATNLSTSLQAVTVVAALPTGLTQD